MDVSSARRVARVRPLCGRSSETTYVVTPYAGANRIRFNGTLSAGALGGGGTPVNEKI